MGKKTHRVYPFVEGRKLLKSCSNYGCNFGHVWVGNPKLRSGRNRHPVLKAIFRNYWRVKLSIFAGMRAPSLNETSSRVNSVDLLRGLVMVIMAIDHTREFWCATPVRPEDVTQASVGLFFTRWITHLCAPTFIFLSGVSIHLYMHKKGRHAASRFVLTRGLWLIAVEFLVMGPVVTHGFSLIVFGIFWVIGASMVLMALFIRLPNQVLVILAVVMIAGHNALPLFQEINASNFVIALIHNTPFSVNTNPPLLVAYTVVPWVAVMMLGFVLGSWFTVPVNERIKRFFRVGFGLLVFFLVLRSINVYGDLVPWSHQERGTVYTVLSFINVFKYPPSLLFLCLMLGMALTLLALFDRFSLKSKFLSAFGQVPFFFFVLHFVIISIFSAVWSVFYYGKYVNFAFTSPQQWPAGYEPSLLRLYLVWALVIAVTYVPCRWYANYKQTRKHWWLSYV